MVKRRALLKTIAAEARRQAVEWGVAREGGRHTIYRLGATRIPVPRHTELDERLAQKILKDCEAELGDRWWR